MNHHFITFSPRSLESFLLVRMEKVADCAVGWSVNSNIRTQLWMDISALILKYFIPLLAQIGNFSWDGQCSKGEGRKTCFHMQKNPQSRMQCFPSFLTRDPKTCLCISVLVRNPSMVSDPPHQFPIVILKQGWFDIQKQLVFTGGGREGVGSKMGTAEGVEGGWRGGSHRHQNKKEMQYYLFNGTIPVISNNNKVLSTRRHYFLLCETPTENKFHKCV